MKPKKLSNRIKIEQPKIKVNKIYYYKKNLKGNLSLKYKFVKEIEKTK